MKKYLFLILFTLILINLSFAEIIAYIDVHETKIISQSNHNLEISFIIANKGDKFQDNILYGVFLTKTEKGNQIQVDNKVYSQIIALSPKQKISITIDYQAPVFLDGEYDVWVIAENEIGMPYGIGYAGKVKFKKESEFVEIKNSSCFLTVGNERYSLGYGVDVEEKENILLHCQIINHFNENKTVIPKFTTYLRSQFGKLVDEKILDDQKISLDKKESKNITLNIPKVLTPQSYDINLIFLDSQTQKEISNQVIAHYVIVGESATIQNLLLDKENYQKGEKAKISFYWTPRADISPRPRTNISKEFSPKVSIVISDKENNPCAKEIIFNPTSTPGAMISNEIETSMEKDCYEAKVEAKISGSQNQILSQRIFRSPMSSIYSTKEIKPFKFQPTTTSQKEKPKSSTINIVLISVILVIIVFIITILFKSKNKLSILVIIILSGFIYFNPAKAITWTVPGGPVPGEINHLWGDATYSASLNKDEFLPGETVIVTASTISTSVCNNGWQSAKVEMLQPIYSLLFDYVYDANVRQETGSKSGSDSFSATGTPGTYSVILKGYTPINTANATLDYQINQPPPDIDASVNLLVIRSFICTNQIFDILQSYWNGFSSRNPNYPYAPSTTYAVKFYNEVASSTCPESQVNRPVEFYAEADCKIGAGGNSCPEAKLQIKIEPKNPNSYGITDPLLYTKIFETPRFDNRYPKYIRIEYIFDNAYNYRVSACLVNKKGEIIQDTYNDNNCQERTLRIYDYYCRLGFCALTQKDWRKLPLYEKLIKVFGNTDSPCRYWRNQVCQAGSGF